MRVELVSGIVTFKFAQGNHPHMAKHPYPPLLQIQIAVECPQTDKDMVPSGLLSLHTGRSLGVQVKSLPLERAECSFLRLNGNLRLIHNRKQ